MSKLTEPMAIKHESKIVKYLMIFVGISGCFSILFGAWLAHGGKILPMHVQSSLQTALQYQLFHTLALLAVLIWAAGNLSVRAPSKVLLTACICFFVGILCFSGAIYIKTFFSITIIGKLAPFGGISLAMAWLLLSIEGKNNL